MTVDRFIDKAQAAEMVGLSHVTIWRMERAGEFPRRRQISPNRVAYLESEVREWMQSRPAYGSNQADHLKPVA